MTFFAAFSWDALDLLMGFPNGLGTCLCREDAAYLECDDGDSNKITFLGNMHHPFTISYIVCIPLRR